MDNTKSDSYFVKKIYDDLSFISEQMKDVSESQFDTNPLLQDSMMFRMIQISENTKRLSDEYKIEHNDIPWSDITGLRNRIVHDYGNVDPMIVYDTLVNDIPDLITQIMKKMKQEMGDLKNHLFFWRQKYI